MMYEMMTSTMGRRSSKPYSVPYDDPYNQFIRTNLGVKEVAARFGVNQAHQVDDEILSIDRAIEFHWQTGNEIHVSEKMLSKIREFRPLGAPWWNRLFAPIDRFEVLAPSFVSHCTEVFE